MINIINVESELFKDYIFESKEREIKNLSNVNIFIGENNSGKSRFLRHLYSIGEFEFIDNKNNLSPIVSAWKQFTVQANDVIKRYGGRDNAFEVSFDSINFKNYFTEETENEVVKIITTLRHFSNLNPADFRQYSSDNNHFENYTSNIKGEITNLANNYLSIIEAELKKINYKNNKYSRFYIPILRGLRAISGNTDGFKERIIKDHFAKANESKKTLKDEIFTGLDFYGLMKDQILSPGDVRKKIKHFEEFIKNRFFPKSKEFTITPENKSDNLLVGFGGENDEHEIFNLGDGIQALILLLYPIFMKIGEKSLFFIEEPELNLHPGMQRVFIETLLSKEFEGMQFFFTTHSNHFLDLTVESDNISVFQFSKKENSQFTIKNIVRGDKNILKELGILNSSLFLANCTIWVEGVTDRKYIRKYLELYWKENKPLKSHLEDLHYSFIEFAGSNIVHWNFEDGNKDENISAFKINQNIFLILDSDVNSKGEIYKEERHKKLKSVLADKLYITEGKEIENSLTLDVIKKVTAGYENVQLSDLIFKKSTNEIVKSKSHNSDEEIEKPYFWKDNIGKLIDSSLKEKKRKADYAESNTIRDKDAFCDKAIKHLENYSDLSREAIDLCKKLTDFIESCNK